MPSATATSEIELSATGEGTVSALHERTSVVEDDTSDVLAASRLADSTVPEGGYGWVVIFACSVITFWYTGTCKFTLAYRHLLISCTSLVYPSDSLRGVKLQITAQICSSSIALSVDGASLTYALLHPERLSPRA